MRDSIRSEFTPSYKYNPWVKDRKTTGATPLVDNEERELWEQEQRRCRLLCNILFNILFVFYYFILIFQGLIVSGMDLVTMKVNILITFRKNILKRKRWN
jgi:hypothetical protein